MGDSEILRRIGEDLFHLGIRHHQVVGDRPAPDHEQGTHGAQAGISESQHFLGSRRYNLPHFAQIASGPKRPNYQWYFTPSNDGLFVRQMFD
jgi:hypothetical protein